jgi:hypothetical protein
VAYIYYSAIKKNEIMKMCGTGYHRVQQNRPGLEGRSLHKPVFLSYMKSRPKYMYMCVCVFIYIHIQKL